MRPQVVVVLEFHVKQAHTVARTASVELVRNRVFVRKWMRGDRGLAVLFNKKLHNNRCILSNN